MSSWVPAAWKWKGKIEALSHMGLNYSDGKLRYCLLKKGTEALY